MAALWVLMKAENLVASMDDSMAGLWAPSKENSMADQKVSLMAEWMELKWALRLVVLKVSMLE